MKNLFIILCISVLQVFAQTKFDFDFDYAQFGYDSTSNYLEIYYSFNQSEMKISASDSMKTVDGILQISIEDTSTRQKIVDKEWKVSYPVSEIKDDLNKYLIGVIGFIVPFATYKCSVSGRDFNSENNIRKYTELITSKQFISDEFSVSDIQLASRIIQDSPNRGSIFYKNSMEIFPVPNSVFGENSPVVFFYSELYNLIKPDISNTLLLVSTVYNSKGKSVYTKTKPISTLYDSRVEVGSILINKFPTDTYTFVLALIDSTVNSGVSSTKRFYVFNPSIAQEDTVSGKVSGVFASEFGVMSDEELDDIFNKCKYIATSAEVDKYERISTTEGKREFLYNFWKDRDYDPSTPENEFYKQYLAKIAMSNQKYGSLSRLGWKTDRGRVYIMYGEPSEIERYPNQVDSKPYEIWHYNELEGGVVFVFADLTGFSDYTLLHSTLRGELRDDNWMRRISTY